MYMNMTVPRFVNPLELVGKICCSGTQVCVKAIEVGEVFRKRRNCELFLENIQLIQEHDNRLVPELFTVSQRVKEHHFFMHLVSHMSQDRQIEKQSIMNVQRCGLQPCVGHN